MKQKNIAVLLLALGLGFISYRSGMAASGGSCFARAFLPDASNLQPIANRSGGAPAAPAWQLKNLDGKDVRLADFKGKVVVLNFWATWCPPCRAEIPDLVALQNQYREKGLVVVGVSLDRNGAAAVKAFANRAKINYPIVLGDEATVGAYGGIEVIPTTFFIDRAGNIAGKLEGASDQATFAAAIKPLLDRPKSNL